MKFAAPANDSEPPGVSAGAEATWAEPVAASTRKTAGLILLCDELGRRQAEIDRLSRDGAPPEDLDAALDAWWPIVEAITSKPAKTLKSMRSKARAVRLVMAAGGRDRPPEATALLASLLADLLQESVVLA